MKFDYRLDPLRTGHINVSYYQIGLVGTVLVDTFSAVRTQEHLVSGLLERVPKHRPYGFVIIYDKNSGHSVRLCLNSRKVRHVHH